MCRGSLFSDKTPSVGSAGYTSREGVAEECEKNTVSENISVLINGH